jgi:pectate lyase
MYGNYFDQTGYREPLVAYAKVHVFNNYMYKWQNSAVRSERLAQVYLENNVFTSGRTRNAAIVEPAKKCNDSHKFCDGRAGYLYSVGNVIVNAAHIRSTGPGHVFQPAAAYTYTATPAGPTLGQDIVAGAGSR